MRPVSSEGRWDKQAVMVGESKVLPGSRAPPPTNHPPFFPSSFGTFFLIFFCMKANVLIYVFSVQCVHLETPVVGKLPWLSLKARSNEIWMCREWITVMELAKYCLPGVSAISSWGDRYSGLRKVKPLSKLAHSSAGRGSLLPCNVDDCCPTECFGARKRLESVTSTYDFYL